MLVKKKFVPVLSRLALKIVVMARQKARGKSEEGLGYFTFFYTVWFYCVHLLIVACELRFGAEKSNSFRLKQRIELAFSIIPVLPLMADVDHNYATIRTHLKR
jgi:tRNA(fMet)-specific endonuclease VapC